MCVRERQRAGVALSLVAPGSAPAVCLSVSPASSLSPHLQLRVCLWSPSHQLSLTCSVSSACPPVFSVSRPHLRRFPALCSSLWLAPVLPLSVPLFSSSPCSPCNSVPGFSVLLCFGPLSLWRVSRSVSVSLHRVLPPALPGSFSLPLPPVSESVSSGPFHLPSLHLSLALSVGLSRPSSLRVSGCPSLPLCVSLAPPPFPPFFSVSNTHTHIYLRSNCFCLGWTGLVVGGRMGGAVVLGGLGGTEVAWWS